MLWLQSKLASNGIATRATETIRTDEGADTDLIVRYWPEPHS